METVHESGGFRNPNTNPQPEVHLDKNAANGGNRGGEGGAPATTDLGQAAGRRLLVRSLALVERELRLKEVIGQGGTYVSFDIPELGPYELQLCQISAHRWHAGIVCWNTGVLITGARFAP